MVRSTAALVLITAAALLAGCATAHQGHGAPQPAAVAVAPPPAKVFQTVAPPAPSVTAKIAGNGGVDLGVATFTEGPMGVVILLEFRAGALTPGWHGAHLHAVGDCSDEKFLKSGAHVGHGAGRAHGLLHPEGPEWGDLPNIFAPATGPFGAEMFTTWVSLKGVAGREMLADADGAALVVHANPDDQATQPIGGAGARVACAVIPAKR